MTIRTAHYAHEMSFGAAITRSGTRFRLWAPDSKSVALHLLEGERLLQMERRPYGWHELEVEGVGEGELYYFRLEDGTEVPDPASRHQPHGVHGPSEVIDPRRFEWQDLGWRGRPWEETVVYELHVGTFTPQGTFEGAREKLKYLAELGVTAIELMPIGEFSGRWNWGYDGVALFAPDHTYGRPEDLKRLVETAHELGLMVFLDVVYNHFGPEGNYLASYAPLLTDKHETPWGAAVNYDDDGADVVRNMIITNTLFWLNEYRFDGLRFDAVHAIKDSGPRHLLIELAEQARGLTDGREAHLVVENSSNEAGWMKRGLHGKPWLFTAQWSDDIHHAFHNLLTGEKHWYYGDFDNRIDLVGRGLAEGLGYQGEYSPSEEKHRGESAAGLPPTAFVAFVQNHDQIGNRPHGDRLITWITPEAYKVFATSILLAPTIPMLFMGEEFGATTPFEFFSDVQELAEPIREGRRNELKLVPPELREEPLPDPVSEEAFMRSKLDWSAAEGSPWLEWYRTLIGVRHEKLVPLLPEMPTDRALFNVLSEKAVMIRWVLAGERVLSMWINFGDEEIAAEGLGLEHQIWVEGRAEAGKLGPMSLVVTLEAPSP
jgi:maltooligosyltrehalose trehalohydrolase